MSALARVERYIGLPFADHGRRNGFDCWGLVRHVLAAEQGLALPDYGKGYQDVGDHAGIRQSIIDGLAEQWQRVAEPALWGLVIFNIRGNPHHVGLVVGPNQFLHAPEGQNSRIERLSDGLWARRIEGFYVYRG